MAPDRRLPGRRLLYPKPVLARASRPTEVCSLVTEAMLGHQGWVAKATYYQNLDFPSGSADKSNLASIIRISVIALYTETP